MNKELPSGYVWRTHTFADDEGIVINVTLVASTYKEGTWKDRFFSRKVLNSQCEVELEATDEEIAEKVGQLKTRLTSLFFDRK